MPTILMGDTNEWREAAGCLKDFEPHLPHRADRPELSLAASGGCAATGSSSTRICGSMPPGCT